MQDATKKAIEELFPPREKVAPCPWCGRIAQKRIGARTLHHTPRKCCDAMRLLVGSWLVDEIRLGRAKIERWIEDAQNRANGTERDPTSVRLRKHGAAYEWESFAPEGAVGILPSLSRHLYHTTSADDPCVMDEMREYLSTVDDPQRVAKKVVQHLKGWPRLGDSGTVAFAAQIAADLKSAELLLGPPNSLPPAS